MKICVIYDSVTGNTKMLADRIQEKYRDRLTDRMEEADVIFLGSWTDNGSMSGKIKEQAEKLREFISSAAKTGYTAIILPAREYVSSPSRSPSFTGAEISSGILISVSSSSVCFIRILCVPPPIFTSASTGSFCGKPPAKPFLL